MADLQQNDLAVNPSPGAAPRARWRWAAAVLLVTVVATLTRAYKLDAKGLWLDEAGTVQASAGRAMAHQSLEVNRVYEVAPDLLGLDPAIPWHRVWTTLGRDVHPPLHYQLLRVWRGVVPSTDAGMRWLSVLFAAATVPPLCAVGRRLFGATAGLWAGAVFAVAPAQVFHDQQVRMYAMAVALAAVVMWAVVRGVQDGWTPGRVATVTLASAAMLLTHYFTIGTFAAAGIYSVVAARRPRDAAVGAAALAGGAVVFAAAWAPWLLDQLAVHAPAEPWMVDRRAGSRAWRMYVAATAAPLDLLARPFGRLVFVYGDAPAGQAVTAAFTAVAVVLPALLLRRRRWALLLPWLAMVSSLGIPFALDLTRGLRTLDYVRFSLLAGVPLYLVLAGVVRVAAPRAGALAHAVPAAAVLFGLLSFDQAYEVYWADPKVLAGPIALVGEPGQPVVYHGLPADQQPSWARPADLFLCVHRYVRPGHPVVLTDRVPLDDALLARLRQGPSFWVVGEMVKRSWRNPPGTAEHRPTGNTFEFPLGFTILLKWEDEHGNPTAPAPVDPGRGSQ